MFNNNDDSTFYSNKSGDVDRTFAGAINSKKIVDNKLSSSGNEIQSYIDKLNELINTYSKYKDLTLSEKRVLDDIIQMESRLETFQKTKVKDMDKYTELTKGFTKESYEAQKKIYELKLKNNELTEGSQKEELKNLANLKDDYNIINKDISDLSDHIENAKKKTEYLKNSYDEIKNTVRDLSLVTGLDTLKEEISGQGSNTWREIRNKVVAELGMSSGEFETFKNSLITTTQGINDSIGQIYFNANDVKNYMSNLSTLGIYDSKMAEEQLKAVIEGNKIANLSYETEAGILKVGRRTNNNDLLNQVNNTIATLLNTEIGLSKEQLNVLVQQSADSANMLSYLGNGQAYTQMLNGSAYLEKNYGQGAGTAAQAILQDLEQNGTSSSYYTALGGADDVLKMAQQDAGQALVMIMQKAQNSGYISAGANNAYASSALGIDNNLRTLYSAKGSGQSYSDFLGSLKKATLEDVQSKSTTSFEDQVKNAVSLVLGMLPISQFLTLGNIFFEMSIVEMTGKFLNGIFKFFSGGGKSLSDVLFGFSNKTGLSNIFTGTGKIGLMADKIFGIAGVLSLIAGGVMFIKDALSASKNPSDYGNDNTFSGKLKSSLVGGIFGNAEASSANALKNAVKWGLIGAGIGTTVLGIGSLAGFVIGGIAGALFGGITGAIGGKNALNNTLGLTNSSSTSKSTGSPIGSDGGYEAFGSDSNTGSDAGKWPWIVTSPFGAVRSYTNTKGVNVNDVHRGIDLSKANASGTPMGANVGGVVSKAGTASDGANFVKILDDNGYTHLYWHLQNKPVVTEGQRVSAGQLIGNMGATGNVTGPHLHYGIVDSSGKYINPFSFITSNLWDVKSGTTSSSTTATEQINSPVETAKQKLVSANTLDTEGTLNRYMNAYGSPGSQDVVDSVNGGFISLISKLDELSDRQNEQRDLLKAILPVEGSSVYKY